MNITIIVSERCTSLGDAMRDIDNKAVIKGDFVLLSAFTISNVKLTKVLEYHRLVRFHVFIRILRYIYIN